MRSYLIGGGGLCRDGTQEEPVQEGQVGLPLEVEEEEDASSATQAQEDEDALQVSDLMLRVRETPALADVYRMFQYY